MSQLVGNGMSARVDVLRARGITTGLPRTTIYDERKVGLGHMHAYAYATAAICDQVERALEGGEGTAARVVAETELANTCARLGCRDEHPMEWRADHLMTGIDRLREDVIMEAYLRARVEMRLRGRLTKGAEQLEGPLQVGKWIMTEEMRTDAGPKLWQATTRGTWQGETGCALERGLAAVGIAMWADITKPGGEWMTWPELCKRWGVDAGDKQLCERYKGVLLQLNGEDSRETRERWIEEQEEKATGDTEQMPQEGEWKWAEMRW